VLGWFVFPAVPPPAPQNASTDASTYGGRTTAMRNLTEARIREIYEDFTQGKLERLAEAFDTNVDFLSHAPSEFFPAWVIDAAERLCSKQFPSLAARSPSGCTLPSIRVAPVAINSTLARSRPRSSRIAPGRFHVDILGYGSDKKSEISAASSLSICFVVSAPGFEPGTY